MWIVGSIQFIGPLTRIWAFSILYLWVLKYQPWKWVFLHEKGTLLHQLELVEPKLDIVACRWAFLYFDSEAKSNVRSHLHEIQLFWKISVFFVFFVVFTSSNLSTWAESEILAPQCTHTYASSSILIPVTSAEDVNERSYTISNQTVHFCGEIDFLM